MTEYEQTYSASSLYLIVTLLGYMILAANYEAISDLFWWLIQHDPTFILTGSGLVMIYLILSRTRFEISVKCSFVQGDNKLDTPVGA